MNARYLPNVLATPTQLINTKGQAQFGLFENSVHNLNFADYSYRTVMDTLAGKLSRHFAAKQFQFVSVCGPELVIGRRHRRYSVCKLWFCLFF